MLVALIRACLQIGRVRERNKPPKYVKEKWNVYRRGRSDEDVMEWKQNMTPYNLHSKANPVWTAPPPLNILLVPCWRGNATDRIQNAWTVGTENFWMFLTAFTLTRSRCLTHRLPVQLRSFHALAWTQPISWVHILPAFKMAKKHYKEWSTDNKTDGHSVLIEIRVYPRVPVYLCVKHTKFSSLYIHSLTYGFESILRSCQLCSYSRNF
jgi:hypothetical protein